MREEERQQNLTHVHKRMVGVAKAKSAAKATEMGITGEDAIAALAHLTGIDPTEGAPPEGYFDEPDVGGASASGEVSPSS